MATIEERMEVVERLLRKIAPRTTRTVRGLIPWLPISGRTERPAANGECFSFMFPLSGTIKRFLIAVEKMPEGKKEVEFEIEIIKADRAIFDKVVLKGREVAGDVTYPVVEGMRARVICREPVEGIWVSFLIAPDRQYYTPVDIGG